MKHASIVLVFCAALACNSTSGDSQDDNKRTVVNLDDLKSRAPADWKEQKPSNNMRFMQFQLPKAKDDAELVIFKGITGSAKDNIKRWKDQFIPPKDKNIDDVASVKEMKVGKAVVTYLDVKGTYKFKERPFDPKSPEEKRADYRMLGVQFEGPDNIYHIKLVGPAGTVEQYKKGFDDWLNAFK